MKAKTEKQLIKLCKGGNEQAFEELIEREGEYIRGWVYSFSKGNYFLAEDIFQTTIIRCWQKIKSFKGKCKFATWANNIARNAFFDEYRRNSRRQVLSLDQGGGPYEGSKFITHYNKYESKSPSYNIERQERVKQAQKITNKVLRKLSQKHRRIIKMADQEEMEYHEISEKLNIPLGTVMSRLFYARKKAFTLAQQYKKELI